MANGTKARDKTAKTDARLVAFGLRVRAILVIAPLVADVDALRCLLDPMPKLRTLRDVAIVFGVSLNTVQRSWRGGGMPGNPGAFDAAEIVVWYLKREAANREKKNSLTGFNDERRQQLADLEIERAKLALEWQRARLDKASDHYVDRTLFASNFATVLSRIRSAVIEIPDQILPHLPPANANTICEFVDGLCRTALTAAADDLEQLADDGFEDANNDVG